MISIICNLEWCVSRIMYGNDWEWKTHTTYVVLHTTIIGGNIKQILIQMMEFFLLQFNLDTKPKHQFTIEHFQNSRFFLRNWGVFRGNRPSNRTTMEMEFCIYSWPDMGIIWPKVERYFHISLNLVLRFDEGIKSQNLQIIASLGAILTYCLRVYGNADGFSRLQISCTLG